jgi:Domain of unknown function (DUF3786)
MEKQRGENPFDEPVRILKSADPRKLAVDAEARWEAADGDSGKLLLPVLNDTVTVLWPEVKIEAPPGLDSFSLKLLSLLYLANTDGTPPSGQWIAYRELPGGRFYEPVVKRSVEDPLAQVFSDDLESFTKACRKLSDRPLSMGDTAFSFALFPHVLLAFIMWGADEEFPARAQVLFDSASVKHLNAFDLRMGAQEISLRIIRAGGGGSGG